MIFKKKIVSSKNQLIIIFLFLSLFLKLNVEEHLYTALIVTIIHSWYSQLIIATLELT